jgi:hypothetical protein
MLFFFFFFFFLLFFFAGERSVWLRSSISNYQLVELNPPLNPQSHLSLSLSLFLSQPLPVSLIAEHGRSGSAAISTIHSNTSIF